MPCPGGGRPARPAPSHAPGTRGSARRIRPRRGSPSPGRSASVPWEPPSPGLGPDLDDRALRPGHRAPEQEEVVLAPDVDHLEAPLGDLLVAHLPGTADA